MSKFKRCESCGIVVTRIKRSRFDNTKSWDAIRWQRPNDPGDPDRFIGTCNDGSYLKEINPVFIFCKTCIECYGLLDLEVDFDKKEWIIPEEISKIIFDKINKGHMSSTATVAGERRG